ncbi:hypothetical protein TNCV_1020651 [Trichonephila clavipes]|uniref:Uncharacterized protein n=1 Tax=Trichonephila clavipes TaxID=2585209 RepID=A0A8X6VP92_TRICX|nr:hypothetical protein TNCV_1020651 [Trichonephila clavipes]
MEASENDVGSLEQLLLYADEHYLAGKLPLGDHLGKVLHGVEEYHQSNVGPLRENTMANAFWVSVRKNVSKRWNTTENDSSKNQSSADSAIRLPNTSILNSNAADITEYSP